MWLGLLLACSVIVGYLSAIRCVNSLHVLHVALTPEFWSGPTSGDHCGQIPVLQHKYERLTDPMALSLTQQCVH